MQSTDPAYLKNQFDSQSMGSLHKSMKDPEWRLKNEGDMNYDMKGIKGSSPNIIIGAYNRDFQRKNDMKQFYADVKNQYLDEQRRKKEARANQVNLEHRHIHNHVNLKFCNFHVFWLKLAKNGSKSLSEAIFNPLVGERLQNLDG